MPITRAAFKPSKERTHVIRTVRHFEAPRRREPDLAGICCRTQARKGSTPAAIRCVARRIRRFRSEEPTDCGEGFGQFAGGRLTYLQRGELRAMRARPRDASGRNSIHEDSTRHTPFT